MSEYLLYRIGSFLVNSLPWGFSYFLARVFSLLQYLVATKDRRAVINNIKTVTNGKAAPFSSGAKMYMNFGLYLVDFFRFDKINKSFVDKHVRLIGKEHLDEALKKGRGVIALTAHLGNWELGGAATALLGYNIAGVALQHKDPRVNAFFNRQRNIKGLEVIPIGIAVRRCYKLLKENKIVALLGDRDFSEKRSSETFKFFGKQVCLPKGPASLALRTGAAIVPGFMVRESGNNFKLIFDKPIYPLHSWKSEEEAEKKLIDHYIPILEKYIHKYSTQWFIFREFWS